MPLDSRIYDRDYFLSDRCEGWDRFREDRGLSPLKLRLLALLDLSPGLRILDAGCGRGEMLHACAERGVRVAGVDYSEAAVELTRETLADVEGAEVRAGDVTALPWPDATFDRVLLGDVVEHLDPGQVEPALVDARRVLRQGGSLVIHTAPNRWFTQFGRPVARIGLRVIGRGDSAARIGVWIEDSRNYHPSEQSLLSLRRAMRGAGFPDAKVWIESDVLRGGEHHLVEDLTAGRLMRLAGAVSGRAPLRWILGNDLYAVGRR